MVNFGSLAAEIVSLVWGTPGNFNAVSRLGSVTARQSSSGRQPNCGVEQRAPPIFGRAAITLSIGPHVYFLSSSILYLFSSPNLSGRRLDVYHTLTHGVALVRIKNAGLKGAACRSLQMQDSKKSPKIAIWAQSRNFVGLHLRN